MSRTAVTGDAVAPTGWRRWQESTAVRLVWRTIRLFRESHCPLWASALTYYSIFAVVPVLALFFGVAKGFGLEEWLDRFLSEKLATHQEILKQIMIFVESTLRETRGGWIAGIGVLVLLYTVVAMIRHIETAFNMVLGVKRGRGILRIFTDYLSMVFVFPLLLVLAGSATLMFHGIIRRSLEAYPLIYSIGRPLVWSLQMLTPWVLSCLVFAILYIVLSNGRLRVWPALAGGVLAAVLMRLLQAGYVYVQVHLTSYNAIYGSFSALPLFLIWLFLSWNVLMIGVALAAAAQGMKTREFDDAETDDGVPGDLLDRRILLLVCALVTRDFARGHVAPGEDAIAERCGVGLRRMRQTLQILVDARLLNKVLSPDDQIGYAPVLPPEQMTTCEVTQRLNALFPEMQPHEPEACALVDQLAALEASQCASPYNRKLSEL